MRKLLLALAVILPALAVFFYHHAESSGWWTYYASFVPADLGVPRNNWAYRVTECGGWLPFWREMWIAFGIGWIFIVLAWRKSPWEWRVLFVILWLGCFAACMVSHDKMRLWYRITPAAVPMIVWWISSLVSDSKMWKRKFHHLENRFMDGNYSGIDALTYPRWEASTEEYDTPEEDMNLNLILPTGQIVPYKRRKHFRIWGEDDTTKEE